jgi:hypothetical protein
MTGITFDDLDESYIERGEPIYDPLPMPPSEIDRLSAVRRKAKFALEPFSEIGFESREEWLIKRTLPRQGVAAVYGRSKSLKSFLVSHIGWHISAGIPWAGLKVQQGACVYIGAEGANGLRKRKVGFAMANPSFPKDVPFYLIAGAPNLGTEKSDLAELIAAIEAAGVGPILIIIDTLAQTMGSGDENGAGMTQFIANANALATHFKALVLIVHHVGLGDDQRLRGHSSLHGALDAQILCERIKGTFSSKMTLQKLKDEASDRSFTANLSRFVIGHDEDGEEETTLVVDAVIEESAAPVGTVKAVTPAMRLLMSVVQDAIDAEGADLRPYGQQGPVVRAVSDRAIRERYYARIAEEAESDEKPEKLAERQRRAFNRGVENALKTITLVAADIKGRRYIWLP